MDRKKKKKKTFPPPQMRKMHQMVPSGWRGSARGRMAGMRQVGRWAGAGLGKVRWTSSGFQQGGPHRICLLDDSGNGMGDGVGGGRHGGATLGLALVRDVFPESWGRLLSSGWGQSKAGSGSEGAAPPHTQLPAAHPWLHPALPQPRNHRALEFF